MQCHELQTHWPSFVSGQLAQEQLEQLKQHAKSCPACRQQFEDHAEVQDQLQGMLHIKSGEEIVTALRRELKRVGNTIVSKRVEGTTMANPQTSSADSQAPVFRSSVNQDFKVVAALLLGILIGIVGTKMLSGGQLGGMQNQIAMELMHNSRGMSPSSLAMLFATGRSSLFSAIPTLTNSSKTLLCIIAIAAFARTRFWESLAISTLPAWFRAARATSLIVIILGIGIVGAMLYVKLTASASTTGFGNELRWLMQAHSTAMELWSVSCWATIAFVILGVLQLGVERSQANVRD